MINDHKSYACNTEVRAYISRGRDLDRTCAIILLRCESMNMLFTCRSEEVGYERRLGALLSNDEGEKLLDGPHCWQCKPPYIFHLIQNAVKYGRKLNLEVRQRINDCGFIIEM